MAKATKNFGGQKMKRLLSTIICLAMLLSMAVIFASCGKRTYEIAIVTDVGQLMDKGFNQGTYEGAKAYAEARNFDETVCVNNILKMRWHKHQK